MNLTRGINLKKIGDAANGATGAELKGISCFLAFPMFLLFRVRGFMLQLFAQKLECLRFESVVFMSVRSSLVAASSWLISPGGLRIGGCESYEERPREEYVFYQTLEVARAV